MKLLAVLALALALILVWAATFVHASDGVRKPGSWPKPAERCTTLNRGTLKWVHDQQNEVWIKWACRCNIGAITVCHWKLIMVTKHLYLRVQLPDGSWYIPAGWHKHRHWVFLPMAAGGYCIYLWPVWHYVPLRLR